MRTKEMQNHFDKIGSLVKSIIERVQENNEGYSFEGEIEYNDHDEFF